MVVIAYAVIVCVTAFIKRKVTASGISIPIGRMNIIVKEGDIFSSTGWRVIGFNEYYDTQVDDIIIDKASLNGKLIESLDDNGMEELRAAISADDSSSLVACYDNATSKFKYPLGRIKLFKHGGAEYMLLALTHFDSENKAFTNRGEYEQTLRTMWSEIDRTYASKPIFLPLLGSKKARLNMSNQEILRCMLCTLRTSEVKLTKPVTIVLTKETLKEIDLYELRSSITMAYRNGNYSAFYVAEPFSESNLGASATHDFCYYSQLRMWKGADSNFPFVDSHNKNYNVRDSSSWETLKARLHERLNNSKNIVLFLSSITVNSKALREEVDYGINTCGLPVIAIYPDYSEKSDIGSSIGIRQQIKNLWDKLPMFRDSKSSVAVLHIPNKKSLITSALKDEGFMISTMKTADDYYYTL